MKPVRRRHPHPEIPLVSTADVAFLLLIFFLATAVFSSERGIVLGLPSPGQPGVVVPLEKVARVQVGADETIFLDGAPLPAGGLRGALRQRLLGDPDLIVTLSIHPGAPYAALVGTLDQVKLSGARQISLQTGTGS